LKVRIVLVLAGVMCLTACDNHSRTVQASPSAPIPSQTAVPTSLTPISTSIPELTQSSTPTPTQPSIPTFSVTERQELATPVIPTAEPSLTPTIFPTYTRRPPRTPEPTIPAETLSVRATLAAAAVNTCEGAESPPVIDWVRSPDGQWLAVICDPDHNDQTYTKVFRLDGTKAWQVPFYETYGITQQDKINPEGIRSGAMLIVHWSADSQYLYLVPWVRRFDGNCMNFYSGPALYRLELSNGNVTATLHPTSSFWQAYNYSLSPNDRYLAYVSPLNGNIIHIFALATGEEKVITLSDQFINAGMFLWSPNMRKLAFAAGGPNWCDTGKFTIFVYDLENGNLKALPTHNLLWLKPKEWVSEEEILVGGSTTSENSEYVEYILNVISGEMVPVPSATPTLSP
jgi:hypothetical protein